MLAATIGPCRKPQSIAPAGEHLHVTARRDTLYLGDQEAHSYVKAFARFYTCVVHVKLPLSVDKGLDYDESWVSRKCGTKIMLLTSEDFSYAGLLRS